jgi:hypothetical protein
MIATSFVAGVALNWTGKSDANGDVNRDAKHTNP